MKSNTRAKGREVKKAKELKVWGIKCSNGVIDLMFWYTKEKAEKALEAITPNDYYWWVKASVIPVTIKERKR